MSIYFDPIAKLWHSGKLKSRRAGALLSESFSTNLGMPLTSNLSWINEDRRGTNQLLGLGLNIIPITVAMLTGLVVIGTHTERMRLPFNDLCRGSRSSEQEEFVIHFLYQCPSLARCRYMLFGSSTLVNLVSTKAAFSCGITTHRHECSSVLLV